jgi:hypothetical protein
MPKQLPPINELTLCQTCLGCNQLDMPKFTGVVKCDSYVFGYPEYYKRMNIEYGAEVEAKKNRERNPSKDDIIDQYWKGD